jgi:hypothetical protein
MFIIFYNHYLPKKFRIKKPIAKIKILNLINLLPSPIKDYGIHFARWEYHNYDKEKENL